MKALRETFDSPDFSMSQSQTLLDLERVLNQLDLTQNFIGRVDLSNYRNFDPEKFVEEVERFN